MLVDLSEAQHKVDGYEQELIKAQRKLEERVVRSPTDGTVQQLAVHTVGGVVTPAQQLMAIVSLDSRFEVEAMVSNRDIGFVREGQIAAVKVDTFSLTRYGLIEGRVIGVSRDAITRETPTSSQQYGRNDRDRSLKKSSEPAGQEMLYAARIDLEKSRIVIEGNEVDSNPGMAVAVEIKTGHGVLSNTFSIRSFATVMTDCERDRSVDGVSHTIVSFLLSGSFETGRFANEVNGEEYSII